MILDIPALVRFLGDYHRAAGDGALDADLVRPDLPPPLRKIYLHFGKWTKWGWPLSTQNRLLPVEELLDEGGYVRFAIENQGNWCCWFRPGEDAVYCDAEAGGGVKNAEIVHESIEQFLISFALLEAVMCSPEIVYLDEFKPAGEVLPTDWRDLHLGGRFVSPLSPLEVFYAPSSRALAIRTPLDDLWIASYEPGLMGRVNNNVEVMQIQPRLNPGPHGEEAFVGNSKEPKTVEPHSNTRKRRKRGR